MRSIQVANFPFCASRKTLPLRGKALLFASTVPIRFDIILFDKIHREEGMAKKVEGTVDKLFSNLATRSSVYRYFKGCSEQGKEPVIWNQAVER